MFTITPVRIELHRRTSTRPVIQPFCKGIRFTTIKALYFICGNSRSTNSNSLPFEQVSLDTIVGPVSEFLDGFCHSIAIITGAAARPMSL